LTSTSWVSSVNIEQVLNRDLTLHTAFGGNSRSCLYITTRGSNFFHERTETGAERGRLLDRTHVTAAATLILVPRFLALAYWFFFSYCGQHSDSSLNVSAPIGVLLGLGLGVE
jgi:hypothetical protein